MTNASTLTLRDAVLLAPGGVERLGDLQPGETRAITLSLIGGRAAPPAGLNAPVYGPKLTTPVVMAAPVDTTIDDILGSVNYYDDRRLFRRYSLLAAVITTGRGGGVYLAGWAAAAPAAAAIAGTSAEIEAETLYLIGLPAGLAADGGALTLPPGLMVWSAIASAQQSGAAAPYDTSLMPGDEMAFQFTPARPVNYQHVRALTLALDGVSYGANSQVTPAVELWDFTRADWIRVSPVTYGRQTIEAPERYVGVGGEIRARLRNATADTLGLTSLEFTLTLEP